MLRENNFFSAIATSIFWEILGYVTVIGGKVIPLFLIAILDIIIFIKLKVSESE